jgi:hypothetical protein
MRFVERRASRVSYAGLLRLHNECLAYQVVGREAVVVSAGYGFLSLGLPCLTGQLIRGAKRNKRVSAAEQRWLHGVTGRAS